MIKRTLNLILLILPFFLAIEPLNAQTRLRVMFYNVENLFYPSLIIKERERKDAKSIHPGLASYRRFNHKINQISKVISAAGEWGSVAIVGLCEVSCDSALYNLKKSWALTNSNMGSFITDGADLRGINSALLFQEDKYRPMECNQYVITHPYDPSKTTRNILHVYGLLHQGVTLDIFICHFPSRYGGEKESEKFRFAAARTLRGKCDSIYAIRKNANIVIMGDFNDTPQDRSIKELLGALSYKDIEKKISSDRLQLINMFDNKDQSYSGSHKYQGEWSRLDQMIVSSNMLDGQSVLQVVPESFKVFSPSFLLTKDKTWGGNRPYRSYYGYKYEGGFSDHLPIIMDLNINSEK